MPKSYYPPCSLKQALIIATTIFDKNAGKPMFKIRLAEQLNKSPESRPFRDLITASGGYGLTSGSYISDKITLEPAGENLAKGDMEAAYTALFANAIFQKFYDHFGSGGSKGVPPEKVAMDFLQSDCEVPENRRKAIFEGIIENARDWHLIQTIGGGDKIVPLELAREKAVVSTVSVTQEAETVSSVHEEMSPRPNTSAEPSKTKAAVGVSPTLQLNIEIHIAAETSEEKIEAIFKNMKKYLLTNGD